MRIKIISLLIVSFALTACGGSSGGGKPKSSSSKAASSASSTVTTSVATTSTSVAASSSPVISSSAAASSVGPVVIIADMTTGWSGNGTGNTGVAYSTEGVSFTPNADNQGAVFIVPKGALLEKATIEMVVNVSSEYKNSGANLQIFAQVENSGDAEWGCWPVTIK
jgi:endo-1,4-beta-xylanase